MDNFCGKRLDGRYEIREIIGVGGMAVVYKAYDNIDDRIVAIKILKDEYLANEEFKRRFKNESKAIAVLSHPNIVRVYNVSFGDRLQYIVMEYVDGITLKEYIEQQGVINWKEAVHFTGQILAALQHAHDKGIVHQDIKPQNIILLHDGTIKVTDFGIARFSRIDNNTTSENAIGSVHYISPEQARGEMTDDKADIYSVGVVLYEMITGQLPFQSDSAVSVALMQLQKEPTRPREIVPTLPLGLEQITIRAMQKNASDRYHSAAEMLMDINEFKRNPAVKFNYTYFVDKEPTRYVPAGASASQIMAAEDSSEEVAKQSAVNKTTAIMIGAISGLVVLAILIFAVLSAVGNKKIVVPDFKNLNYYSDIENNSKYKNFAFEVNPVEDENFSDGTVLAQNPEENTKVKKGSTITLDVVVNNATVLLDESILNMTAEQAEQYLRNTLMLMPVIEHVSSTDKEPGKILYTEPAIGSTVKLASKVTVYVASDRKTVEVPDLTNMTADEARSALESFGLAVGKITEVDSELERGRVVSQEIQNPTTVPEGTKINFSVSTGNKPDVAVDITVKLLNTQKEAKVIIYVDSSPALEKERVLQDNSEKTYTVTGSGSSVPYSVLIDGVKVQEGTIDFNNTSNPVTTVRFDTLPDVKGKSESEAKDMLSVAKFTNVKVTYKEDVNVAEGTVIEQTPASDGTTRVALNTEITLVVATQPPEVGD